MMPAMVAGPPSPYRNINAPLLGVIWAITAIATIAAIARLIIRWQRFARLYWDDLFVIIAWCFAIPLAVQPTVAYVRADAIKTNESLFFGRVITQLFFYTSLWSTKISFLVFFHRVSTRAIRSLRIYWRVVLGITVLTYFCLWTTNPYDCYIKKSVKACELDPRVQHLKPITFNVVCALDILTDCLIMAIPFATLRHVRLSQRQRYVLYPLFSLVVITMMVAIVRAVISTQTMTNHWDITWLLFLALVEAFTAIFIACIGSFRALFTEDDRSRSPSYRRSWISRPMRGRFPQEGMDDDLRLTDLQYMAPSMDDKTQGDEITKPATSYSRNASTEARDQPKSAFD